MPRLLDDDEHRYIYGPGIVPIAQHDGTAAEYLYGDLLGTTLLIADNNGTVCGAYAYLEHGRIKSHTGTTTTAIGYTGNWTRPRWIDRRQDRHMELRHLPCCRSTHSRAVKLLHPVARLVAWPTTVHAHPALAPS